MTIPTSRALPLVLALGLPLAAGPPTATPAHALEFGALAVADGRRGHVDADSGRVIRDLRRLAAGMYEAETALVASGRFDAVEDKRFDRQGAREVVGIFVVEEVFKGPEIEGERVRIHLQDGILAASISGSETTTRAAARGEIATTPWAAMPESERDSGTELVHLPNKDVIFVDTVRYGITIDDEGGAVQRGETYVIGVGGTSYAIGNRYPYLAWGREAMALTRILRRELALAKDCTEWRMPWDMRPHAMGRFFETATAEQVEKCLANGTSPRDQDESGRTPLHAAALWSNDASVIHALLVAGANVNAEDGDGTTPATEAAGNYHGNAAVFTTLVNAGGSWNHSAVHDGAVSSNSALFPMLVEAGADPNARAGDLRRTPFQMAAAECGTRRNVCGSLADRIPILVEAGADMHLRDARGDTVLHYAAKQNGAEDVEALLAAGMDVDARNENGATPLHMAARAEHGLEVIATLLQAGADPNATDKLGRTPGHWAAAAGWEDNAEALRQAR